jgi:trk system potassium uptake protein TrkA
MKRFVVVGLGNFGMSVSETLHAKGFEVIAIDTDSDLVDQAADFVSRAVVGDGTSVSLLERLGVKGCDAGVVATGDDITSSVLSVLALQDMSIKQIHVKVISHEHARVMERLGVTESIFPERESALSLGSRLSSKAIFKHVRLGLGFSLHEMGVPNVWKGSTLRELNLRSEYNITVVATHDIKDDIMHLPPDPDFFLSDQTALLLAGSDEDLARLSELK